jgi:hypothetical protein
MTKHQPPVLKAGFRPVCINSDGVGIVFDRMEGAPTTTPIKCSLYNAPRATLGDLRQLSCSDPSDLLEISNLHGKLHSGCHFPR